MRELIDDLWLAAVDLKADAVVITTNGTVKKNGEAVMGRGVARGAACRWPFLPKVLGELLLEGNHVYDLCKPRDLGTIVSFPVKDNWWEAADLGLIEHSAVELEAKATRMGWTCVVLPRPGCGNGKLDWADVRPILERYLDDRFVVVYDERKERGQLPV